MELIHNGSFESRHHEGLHYWGLHPDDNETCPGGCTRVVRTDAHSGNCCLEFRHRGPECRALGPWDLENCFYIEQTFDWPVHATGSLSLWIKSQYGAIAVTKEYDGVTDAQMAAGPWRDWTRITFTTRTFRRLLRIRIAAISSVTEHDLDN